MTGDATISREAMLFGSHRYIANPVVIIPDGDGFLLGHGYGTHRQFIGRFTPAELLAYFTSEFDDALLSSLSQAAHAATVAEARRTSTETTTSLLSIKLTL